MKYQEIEGDLIELARQGHFDVIAHGCNCFCKMKRGLAPQMANAFGCDKYPLEQEEYINEWGDNVRNYNIGDINKLGQIEWKMCSRNGVEALYDLAVVNCYTQYHWDTATRPLDYEALTLCLRKINHIFKGKHIGLPQIGCHLAGGYWNRETLTEKERVELWGKSIKFVKDIIQQELKDCDVTVVIYNNKPKIEISNETNESTIS